MTHIDDWTLGAHEFVAGIDANGGAGGNQAFRFGSTGTAGISVVTEGTNTVVRGNTDGDASFEFQLVIEDGALRHTAYTAADFIL